MTRYYHTMTTQRGLIIVTTFIKPLPKSILSESFLELCNFYPNPDDRTIFCYSLDALLCLMAQDGDGGRSRGYHALVSRDCLSAIAIQEPR
jgi:hypothetical protein